MNEHFPSTNVYFCPGNHDQKVELLTEHLQERQAAEGEGRWPHHVSRVSVHERNVTVGMFVQKVTCSAYKASGPRRASGASS
eukprot:scaffold316_cov351-Prasinococcus_capsulatus_cf.AAC.7